MIATSAMSGTFVNVVTPSASNVAAISLSTEFFAPGTDHLSAEGAAAAHHDLLCPGIHGTQYAPDVVGSQRIVRELPATEANRARLFRPRDDFVKEVNDTERSLTTDDPLRFTQADGPFVHYRRDVETRADVLRETTEFRLTIPWFGWLFAYPVRRTIARRGKGYSHGIQPWWAPPDRLDPRQALLLGLLAAASMSAAFANTLFTQTVNFAAKDFGIDKFGQGVGGVVVRIGIVFALPVAFLADRVGRRQMILFAAWTAPLLSALGALVAQLRRARRHPIAWAPDGPRARSACRGGRRRGDAAQQSGLRDQRAGDGERARCRRGRDGVAARRHRRRRLAAHLLDRSDLVGGRLRSTQAPARRHAASSDRIARHRRCGSTDSRRLRSCRSAPTCSWRRHRSSRTDISTMCVGFPLVPSACSPSLRPRPHRSGSSSAVVSPIFVVAADYWSSRSH